MAEMNQEYVNAYIKNQQQCINELNSKLILVATENELLKKRVDELAAELEAHSSPPEDPVTEEVDTKSGKSK